MRTDRQKLDLCRLTLAAIADQIERSDPVLQKRIAIKRILQKIDQTINDTKPEA